MIDDISDITQLYNNGVEYEDSRLQRHQLERDITLRYFDEYLPQNGKILEIGCATGNYTTYLHKRGYSVTAVDISKNEIELCKKKIADLKLSTNIQYYVSDSRDLSCIKETDYDAVLIMGPLYHLVYENDRRKALIEASKHLKINGIIMTAFISRYGVLGDHIKKIPHWIERIDEVKSIMSKGYHEDDNRDGSFRGYFAKIKEIKPLHEEIGFRTIVLAAVEPAISADDESYNKLETSRKQQWLKLLYEMSAKESILESSRHLLYIGKKIREC